MFHWRNIVLPLLLLCCVSCSSLKKDPSQEAKEIYKRGKENMKKMSYKAVMPDPRMPTTIYNKGNPDGTNCYRFESKSETCSYLTMKNTGGEFEFIGNTALKANFQQGRTEISEEGEQAEYSMAEGCYKNIPCYVVTKKTKPDEGRYNSYIKSFSGVEYLISNYSPEQLRELFDNTFTATEICYIGKQDGFIYKNIGYNVHGLKKYTASYDQVEVNASLDDKLFKVPENYTVIVAKNRDEYFKIYSELRKKEMEPMLKKFKQQRVIQAKLERAENISLVDRIKRVNRIYDIDRMKKYSDSNTYLSDYLGL